MAAMTSTRSLLITAAVITLIAGAQARFFPYLPGDVAVERAVQALSPGTAWVAPVISTASAPLKYVLMAIAVLAAWRLAGVRAALVVTAAIAVEQTLGESSKLLFSRPRPSGQLVAVMGAPSGFSFPSTCMTHYSVTAGAVGVLAWRLAARPLRTAVLAISGVVLVVAACARIVPGAHWPSDALGTYAICLSWLAVAFNAAGVVRR
jgi:membrane-associated phospholipid phosphatase